MRRRAPAWITVFGLGTMRPAPGTWGSLPAVVIAGALIAVGLGGDESGRWAWWAWAGFHGVMACVMLAGIAACVAQGDAAEAYFGKKDPGNAVADEVAGQCVPLMFLPGAAMAGWAGVVTLGLAFVSFRVMDVLKPWPANRLQRVPGGWGIVLDDLAAGVMAAAVVQVAARVTLG